MIIILGANVYNMFYNFTWINMYIFIIFVNNKNANYILGEIKHDWKNN